MATMTSMRYQEAALGVHEFGPGTAELLTTAAVQHRQFKLAAELLKRLDDLPASCRKRLKTATVIAGAACHDAAVLKLEGVSSLRIRKSILELVVKSIARDMGQHSNNVTVLHCLLSGALYPELVAQLLAADPELLNENELRWHKKASQLMPLLMETLLRNRDLKAVVSDSGLGPELLQCLSAMIEHQGRFVDGDQGILLDLLGPLVDVPEAADVFCEFPELLTAQVVSASSDPSNLVRRMVAAVLALPASEVTSKLVDTLGLTEPSVWRLIVLHLPWQEGNLGAGLKPEQRSKLRERTISAAAGLLAEDVKAQEVFWTLADDWSGSTFELVVAAKAAIEHSVSGEFSKAGE